MTAYHYHAPDQQQRNKQVANAYNKLLPDDKIIIMDMARRISDGIQNMGIKGALELLYCLGTFMNENDHAKKS